MFPEPTFALTIPSIYDDTNLDCRIYHPHKSGPSGHATQTSWQPRGAVIAHPYPTFGGSYDDAIVLGTLEEMLRKGFAVGTFNFRGAGSSKGRTSWSGSPEIADYISFVGFFVHYIMSLEVMAFPGPTWKGSGTTLSPMPSALEVPHSPLTTSAGRMLLILGGYSYGSLIATHLPTTVSILDRFATVIVGTAEAEIRLRALHLSTQWNKDARTREEVQRGRSSKNHEHHSILTHSMPVTMGGEESDQGTRRGSRESRRSIDFIRRSIEFPRRKLVQRQSSSDEVKVPLVEAGVPPTRIVAPYTCYLLISPLRPPISSFAMMFSKMRTHRFKGGSTYSDQSEGTTSELDEKFVTHPTLAVYGDKDFFTSRAKLRRWAESLMRQPKSRFYFREITGAGHFWQEEGAETQLRSTISQWVQDVLSSQDSGR